MVLIYLLFFICSRYTARVSRVPDTATGAAAISLADYRDFHKVLDNLPQLTDAMSVYLEATEYAKVRSSFPFSFILFYFIFLSLPHLTSYVMVLHRASLRVISAAR